MFKEHNIFMKILFLFALSFVLYSFFCLFYKKFRKDLIYVLAIGGAVNSNIFNINDFPIYIGNLIFGVDSILYTLFVFCIIFIYFYYGKKEAQSLTYTSIASIFVGAIIQFVAYWASYGFGNELVITFSSFLISIVATIVAINLTIMFLEKFKNLNKFVLCALSIVLASIINSTIYFSLVSIFSNLGENFVPSLLGSYIGKLIALIFSVICFIIIDFIEKKAKNTNTNS